MARHTLEQLGMLLKTKRGNRGLRQVAAEMGVSAATLSRVESGKQPDLDSFRKMCAWLNIDPGEFLGYKPTSDGNSHPSSGDAVEMLAHFKAGKTLSPKTAKHLGELIMAIHNAAMAEQDK